MSEGDQNNPFGPGGMDLGGLMQKAREMQDRMQEAQEAAARVKVEGNAGGGMVVAEANGHGTILRIVLEPSLVAGGDKEMLEDLIVAAVNQAQRRAKEAMQSEMGKATGGLPLPIDLSKIL